MQDHHENKEKLISFFNREILGLEKDFSILALRPKYLPSKEVYFEGDFDFLILKDEFEAILKRLYENCKNNGVNFRLIQKFPNKKKFHFYIDDFEGQSITVEFWTAIEFTKASQLYSFQAKSIYNSLRKNKITQAEALSLIYISHLYHKQKDIFSEENKFRFQIFLGQLQEQKETELQTKTLRLLEEIQSEKISLRRAKHRAQRWLVANGIKSQKESFSKLKLYQKALWKKIFYLHRIVPVVGPDGVGKGTISKNALKPFPNWTDFRFKDLYRMRIFYKHIVLRFFNSKDLKKNKLDEGLGYYIFMLASLTIHILPVYVRWKKVLLDRYFLDYYATPIRYLEENQKPKKLKGYKNMLYLTPIPERMVFMGCKNESLFKRKNELSQTAIDYLQDLYIEFILKKRVPEVLFISTENEVEISVRVLEAFLEEGK